MYFKGTVTEIDFKYCRFILENEVTIYAGLYYTQFKDDEIEFPDLNSLVVLEAEIIYNKILFPKKLMCQSVSCRQQTELCLPFIRFIKQCNLQVFDIISIVKTTEKIQYEQIFSNEFLKSINWCQNFTITDLIFKLVPFLNHKNSILDESTYNILTPNAHKVENAKPIDLVKWNFGVNNFKNNQYLIGYLEVSSNIGYIVLRDSKHYLICKIVPDNHVNYSENLSKLLNNFVVIKNYHIITENIKNFGSFQYVFVSINNVHLLEKRPSKKMENEPDGDGINVKIKVINRCSVTYNPSNDSLDCLVHCFIESQENTKECLIRLCGQNFEKYPLFNTDDIYSLSTKMPYFVDQMSKLKSDKYLKMNNINLPVFMIPSDGVLTLLPSEVSESDCKLLNISEVKKVIEKNLEFQKDERDIRGFERNYFKQKPDNQLISFEGVIRKRNTLGPDKYAQKPVKNVNFGIKGLDVHQLYFKSIKFDNELDKTMHNVVFYSNDNLKEAERLYAANRQYRTPEQSQAGLSLYLYNFRLLQTPLGLIENMKVAVRYVLNPKDKKYFKPCLFTSIEPLEYVPSQDFDTTPELTGNLNWGPSVPLGASSHIPGSCLAWGEALLLQMKTLNIHLRCTKCKDTFYPNQELCCGLGFRDSSSLGPKLDLALGIKGTDYSGHFDTFCKNETVLKNIFGLRDREWMIFKKCLLSLKYWTSNSREPERIQQRTSYQKSFAEFLSIIVSLFNEMGFHSIDLKCRKMFKTEMDLYEKWYLVEARSSVNTKNLNIFDE